MREEREALLRGAVERFSPSGQEREVAEYLAAWMGTRGFAAQLDTAGNAMGTRGTGPRTVVLLGHIDTVPGELPVKLEGGALFGRGSVDAKGSFCTFAAAVAELPPETLARATFVCVGATEEEAPSSKGARFALTQYQPDFVLIGEPSGAHALTLGYKGRLIAHATAEKDNFHSAGEGTSAADDLAEFCFRARNWAAGLPAKGTFDAVQLTIQKLSSDGDGLTQRAGATLGLRLPPALAPEQAEKRLRALSADLPLTLDFAGHEVAVRHPKDSPLARALRLAIREHGGEPVVKVKTGTSDMNVVAPFWPVPTAAYGPGDSRLDHTPGEHLPLAEYHAAIDILKSVLARLVSA